MPDETVVLVLTGNLLKDPDYTIEFHRGELFASSDERASDKRSASALDALRRPPVVLDATLDAILRTLDQAEHDEAERA